MVQEELTSGRPVPSWLERTDLTGRVIGMPRREEIDPDIREDLIVQFYSGCVSRLSGHILHSSLSLDLFLEG